MRPSVLLPVCGVDLHTGFPSVPADSMDVVATVLKCYQDLARQFSHQVHVHPQSSAGLKETYHVVIYADVADVSV